MIVGGQPMTSMMKEVLMGESRATALGDMFIISAIGSVMGRVRATAAELLIMPGETATLKWTADRVGIIPFYCTDFCSALHQEMQGYLIVKPKS